MVPDRPGAEVSKRQPAERLDAEIHQLAQTLAERDLQLGRLLLQFHTADGWRRLGFASFSQYAQERLGMSYSAVKARITLARRALRFPAIADALSERRIGFEAAMLIARAASRSTVTAWIERAGERTLKHLAEEVEAASMLQRLALASEVEPPSELTMAELLALRGKIMSTTTAAAFGDVTTAQQQAVADLKGWARRSLVRDSPADGSRAEYPAAGGSRGSTSDGQVSACAEEPGDLPESTSGSQVSACAVSVSCATCVWRFGSRGGDRRATRSPMPKSTAGMRIVVRVPSVGATM